MPRTYITQSKAGHYTVTVKEGKRTVFKQNLIDNLTEARRLAASAVTVPAPQIATSPLMARGTSQDLTQDQQEFVFSCLLQPGQDWRDEISIMLNIEEMIGLLQWRNIRCEDEEQLIAIIGRVVAYFTGTPATCTVCDQDRHLAVEATGYRMGPAGP